uniref:Lymphocyte cytosolic protein 2b n=1 Tax=Cyprinus carpio carpio TaxID=630221 RepID=A0A9J8BQR7_CYPCA
MPCALFSIIEAIKCVFCCNNKSEHLLVHSVKADCFLCTQDMDPRWYVGQMSRAEAEVSLRQMNRDGTFLVRDSSKGCTEQPYTLMVLHQQKVYNIQIRFLGNSDGYSLGTGLNGVENFSSVMDMVMHHMNTPLILIDGMERGGGLHRQCCLMHPAVSNRL